MEVAPSSRRLSPARVPLGVVWSGLVQRCRAVPLTDSHGIPGGVCQLLCPFLATTPWS